MFEQHATDNRLERYAGMPSIETATAFDGQG